MTTIIGLTGGIGSGKTLISDHFAQLGVPIIDTDVIARIIVEPGQPALKKLFDNFGSSILDSSGKLDRGALRTIAFSNKKNKQLLDSITHPAIQVETMRQISKVTYPYCIVVVPLLQPKTEFSSMMKRVLVVTADHEIKINRVMKRSKLERVEVEAIMKTQLLDEDRIAFADDIITNNDTIQNTQRQVEELHRIYLEASD